MHPTTKSPSEMAYCIVGKRRRNLKRGLEKAKQKKEPRLVAIPNQSQLLHTNNNPKTVCAAWFGVEIMVTIF